jgi:hypothetical protein
MLPDIQTQRSVPPDVAIMAFTPITRSRTAIRVEASIKDIRPLSNRVLIRFKPESLLLEFG